MRELIDRFAFEHAVVVATSFLAALLSIRQDVGLHLVHRIMNPLTGFTVACLAGFMMLEAGWPQWLSSGMAYLLGHIGNRLMNALLTAIKLAERDPVKFVASCIALMWQYLLPPVTPQNKNPDGNQ